MCLWNHRMNLLHADARFVDTFERTLYNGFLAGVDLGGEKFFYVTPLASKGNRHRQAFFGCACCPTNVVRFVPSLPGYVYAHSEGGVYVNLYVAGAGEVPVAGNTVKLTQKTRYPWDGRVRITVAPAKAAPFEINLRIPAWCTRQAAKDDLYQAADVPADQRRVTIKINGLKPAKMQTVKGYARIRRTWKDGDVIELDMPMPIRRVYSHPEVEANAGRVALQRGPIVYCLEAVDNDGHVESLYLPRDAKLTVEFRKDLLGGLNVLKGKAMARYPAPAKDKPADMLAVPYYAWDHRRPGPMIVWIAEDPAKATPRPAPAGK